MNRPNGKRTGSISSLNGLKAAAMILVFWWHSPMNKPDSPDLGLRMCEIFFVLSGFLVGVNHWDDEYPDVLRASYAYWKSKFLKIWPLHLIAFVIDCGASLIQSGRAFATRENALYALFNLGLLHAWGTDSKLYFSFNGATWFLSALLFCYLLAPVVISHFRKYRQPALPFIFFIAVRILLEYLNRRRHWYGITFDFHVAPFIHLLEFCAGLTMAPAFFSGRKLLQGRKRLPLLFSLLEIAGLAAYVYFAGFHFHGWLGGYYVLAACVLVLILSFQLGAVSRILSARPFSFFSSVQLEFFILHQAVFHFFQRCFPDSASNPVLFSALLFLLTTGLAFLYQKTLAKKATLLLEKILFRIRKAIIAE